MQVETETVYWPFVSQLPRNTIRFNYAIFESKFIGRCVKKQRLVGALKSTFRFELRCFEITLFFFFLKKLYLAIKLDNLE